MTKQSNKTQNKDPFNLKWLEENLGLNLDYVVEAEDEGNLFKIKFKKGHEDHAKEFHEKLKSINCNWYFWDFLNTVEINKAHKKDLLNQINKPIETIRLSKLEAIFKQPIKIDVKGLSKFLPKLRYFSPGENADFEGICDDNWRDWSNSVLTFSGKKDGGFTEIRSDLDNQKELSLYLTNLPPKIKNQLAKILEGTGLEILEVSTAEKDERAKKEAKNNLLKNANCLKGNTNTPNFTAIDARGILQHGFGYTNSNSDKTILGTVGLGPCIAIAVYNQKTKTAALAHIDNLTTLNSINGIFTTLSDDSHSKLQVHLVGGDLSSQEMAHNLLNMITKMNVEIISCNLISNDSQSLAIDARTGKAYTEIRDDQLDSGQNALSRMKIIGMNNLPTPLMKEYDGRNNLPTPNGSPDIKYSNTVKIHHTYPSNTPET